MSSSVNAFHIDKGSSLAVTCTTNGLSTNFMPEIDLQYIFHGYIIIFGQEIVTDIDLRSSLEKCKNIQPGKLAFRMAYKG